MHLPALVASWQMKVFLFAGYCLYAIFAFSSTLGRKD